MRTRFNGYRLKNYICIALCITLGALIYLRTGVADAVDVEQPVIESSVIENVTEEEPVIKKPGVKPDDKPIAVSKDMVLPEHKIVKPEPVYEKLYSDEDAIALVQMLYGESIGVPTLYTWDGKVISKEGQNAACIWAVLNRWNPDRYSSIYEIITRPYQYHGWKSSNPVDPYWLELVYDVLDRWNREMHGETDVGRMLPADYIYWHGDGTYNYFRNWYNNGYGYWDWSYGDVYTDWAETH